MHLGPRPPRILPFLVVLLLAAISTAAPIQIGPPPQQSERVRSGVSHFERAFYELTPQKLEADAARELDLARVAFERELAANPSSVIAHRYLARIHALRKQPLQAARHYDRVSDLEPLDVDACVLAALAYVDAGRLDDAHERLARAQARTADPVVLARLSEYIARLQALPR